MRPSPRKPRRRTAETPPGRALRNGLIAAALLGLVLVLALKAPNGVPGVQYTKVSADVPDIGNLQRHSDVRLAGKRIGQIMRIEPAGGGVRLQLQLEGDAGQVPEDSTVVVRSVGLLGQRYLDVQAGRSGRMIGDGDVLRAGAIPISYGIPEALETFDRDTRGGLGQTVRGLGRGLLGRGRDLNDAIAVATGASRDFRTIASAVTIDEAAARELLPNLTDAATALDESRDSTVAILRPGLRALAPFVDRRKAVRDSLSLAPSTLANARSGLDAGVLLLSRTRRLARSADAMLQHVPGALRATTALLRDSRAPLARARPQLRHVKEAVPPTLRLTSSLAPVLTPLRAGLTELVHPLEALGAHGCDVANFAQTWRSFLAFGSPGGGKIGPLGQIRAEALVRMPYAEAGDAVKLPATLVDRNPYPQPCAYLGGTYSLTDPR